MSRIEVARVAGALLLGVLLNCGRGPAPLSEPSARLSEFDPLVQEQYHELRSELVALWDEGVSGPAWGAALGRWGMWHHAYGFLDEAANAYAGARSLDAEEPRWAYFEGLAHVSAGAPSEAEESFGSALALEPTSVAARVHRAEVRAELGQLDGAEDDFLGALEEAPDCVRGLVGLGNLRVVQGRYEEARELLRHALRLQKDSARIRHALGLALRAGGEAERAKAHLSLVVPDQHLEVLAMRDPWGRELAEVDLGSSGRFRQARRAANAGRFGVALENYLLAIRANPEFLNAHLGAVRALRELQRFDEAEKRILEIREQFPPDARIEFQHALICVETRSCSDRGRPYLLAALDLRSDFSPALMRLAHQASARGDLEEALGYSRRVRELDPTDTEAVLFEVRLLRRAGRGDEAQRTLEEALPLVGSPAALELELHEDLVG